MHLKAVIMTDRETIYKCFKNPPVIETPRLILRKMAKSDSREMFAYASNPEVTRYLLWEPHISESYTYKYLTYLQSAYRTGKFYDWAVTCRSDGMMIGTCGFTDFNFAANSAEVGYVINPDFWNKGIAPEALGAVLDFGFHSLGIHRIEARYIIGNDRSRRVMEKVGMKFEGILRDAVCRRGVYASVGVCAIIADEFLSRRKRCELL